jgi:hypothetical protein
MIESLFWWGMLVVVIFVLTRRVIEACKRPKPTEIIEDVNKHLYGKSSYKEE